MIFPPSARLIYNPSAKPGTSHCPDSTMPFPTWFISNYFDGDERRVAYLSMNYIFELHELTRHRFRSTTIFYVGTEFLPEHLEVDFVYGFHVWQPGECVRVINNSVDDGGVSSCPSKRVGTPPSGCLSIYLFIVHAPESACIRPHTVQTKE
jgi:hypothetical protein